MNDDEMTPAEFDRRLEHGEHVELTVRRPGSRSYYTVTNAHGGTAAPGERVGKVQSSTGPRPR